MISPQSVQAYKSAIYPSPQQNRGGSRNQSLDWISGIMILYIIILHISQTFPSDLNVYIAFLGEQVLFMFMPWFFFKSGMFMKTMSIYTCLKKASKRLIFPWFIFGFFGLISASLLYSNTYTSYDWISAYIEKTIRLIIFTFAFPGNEPLWFLIVLAICQFMYILLNKVCHINPVVIACISLLSAAILKYHLPSNIVPYTWFSILTGEFFFSIGYALRIKQYKTTTFIFCCILLVTVSIYDTSFIEMRTNGFFVYDQVLYILYFVRALCGIIIVNFIAYKLNQHFRSQGCMGYIGRNSMGYYVQHMPIITLITYILSLNGKITPLSCFFITMLILIICLPVLDIFLRRYWPEALGLRRDRKRMTAPDELP